MLYQLGLFSRNEQAVNMMRLLRMSTRSERFPTHLYSHFLFN